VERAAAELGVGRTTLYQAIQRGEVPVLRIGRRVLVRRSTLARLLADPDTTKLMHFARFDVAVLQHSLGIEVAPVRCTKIAAKLVRTFTDRHGLRDLCRELLGIEISKQQQTSDWGVPELSAEQLAYARHDVEHLPALARLLRSRLRRCGYPVPMPRPA
jgi:excisionase family DNA binding protein